jgi:tetratricopeptide (TPR) repeat protein
MSSKLNAWSTLGYFEEAVEFFDKAIAIRPDYADALYYRGLALLKLRLGADAPENFEMTRNGKKIVLIKREWVSEAVASFDKAIASKPNCPEAYYWRGMALHNLGQYSEAVASFDKAITIKPKYTNAKQQREISLNKVK